jgi:hypothetical protein
MELMCPHCQQKLTIPDQYAGQLMRCPLCNGTFTAPALTPPPPPVFSVVPEAPPQPPPLPAASSISTEPMPPAPPPLPESFQPPPPGEYSRSLKIVFSLRVMPWIPPTGLLLVLLLSFLPWISVATFHTNAWSLAFGSSGDNFVVPAHAVVASFLILAILALIVSIPTVLFSTGLAPTPPFVQALGPWRLLIAGGISALSFLLFLIKYLDFVFQSAPMSIWIKLGFRIHLVVVIAFLIEFWLELRRSKNLPLPRIEAHW